jgi:hypothetical protein
VIRSLFFLFLLICSASVYSRHAQDTIFIVKPDLGKGVIGFEITSEEEQGFRDFIINELSDAFHACLVIIQQPRLENILQEGKPLLYYLITDAHAVYRYQGTHYFEVSTVLYKFPSGDLSAGPVMYVTPNTFGSPVWGKNRPFELAIKKNMIDLKFKIRQNKGSPHVGAIRLDSLVRDERFIDCDKKAYFVQPEFYSKTFGYTPSEGEAHDYARLISSHLGRVLNADFRVIAENEVDYVRGCASIIAHVVFNVPAREVSFSLEKKTGSGEKKIEQVYHDINTKDWNENHIFMKGLISLYSLMDADIKKVLGELSPSQSATTY